MKTVQTIVISASKTAFNYQWDIAIDGHWAGRFLYHGNTLVAIHQHHKKLQAPRREATIAEAKAAIERLYEKNTGNHQKGA